MGTVESEWYFSKLVTAKSISLLRGCAHSQAEEGAEATGGASTSAGPGAAAEDRDDDSASASGSFEDSDYSESERGEWAGRADAAFGEEGVAVQPEGRRMGGPGSIASTYWRPERTDRKALLTVLDERWVVDHHLVAWE